jgi:hypothetical protein
MRILSGLVQLKDGCDFTENSAIMPRPEKCQVRQSSRNEALDDVSVETSINQHRREGEQQVYYALSAIIHTKKTLREGEDKVVKKTLREGEDDSASLEKQTQNLDMFDCQHVEKLSSMNKPISMSMVEKLTIQPTLAPI